MRFALALCIVVGCTLCGNAMALTVRRRAETLNQLVCGIRVLRVRMMRMLEPMDLALKGSECPILERVGRAMVPGGSADEAWRRVEARECRRGGAIDALVPEDLQALKGMFAQLGESGREQQAILLEGTIAALNNNLAEAQSVVRETERLYRSLGLMAGLMLALVVI